MNNYARKWRLGYTLISYLLNVEKTAFCAYVGFAQIFNPVDDGCSNSNSDSVVV